MMQVTKHLQQPNLAHELYPNSDVWQDDLSIISDSGSRTINILPDSTESTGSNTNIRLIDLSPQDNSFEFVLKLFNWSKEQSRQQGLEGFERVKIKRIRLIDSEDQQRQFGAEAFLLNQKQYNPVFAAKWHLMPRAEVRNKVADLLAQQSQAYTKEAIKFLPLWHGARAESLEGILKTGFANLATTDLGYYGKGIYGTSNCEYAKRVYSGGYNAAGILLLNWVSIYSALMVAGIEDIELLKGRGNYANYDAHFIPVLPRNFYYHQLGLEDIYFPMELATDTAVYDEIVVFGSRQILARYVVETSFDFADPEKPFSMKELLGCLSDSSNKLALTREQILNKIQDNPWLPEHYINLSYLLNNNEVIELPSKAEQVLARLPKLIKKAKQDAVSLCQIGLYLDNNYILGYQQLAEVLRNKPQQQQQALLAFPIDKLCSYQDLYQAAIECLDRRFRSDDNNYFRCKSNFLARLSILNLDNAKKKEAALHSIELDSDNAIAWIALGDSLAENERIEFKQKYYNAKKLYLEALKLDPKSLRALLGLAKNLLPKEQVKVEGQSYEAKDLLKLILERKDDFLEALEALLKLQQRLYKEDEELRVYLKNKLADILLNYKEDPKVWLWLSNCLTEDESIWLENKRYSYSEVLHRAFLLDPTNVDLYSKLATASKEVVNFELLEGRLRGSYQREAKELVDDLALYVPILATRMDPGYYQYSEEHLLDLQAAVLSKEHKSMWIYGSPGSSKTMFGRYLEHYLWGQYVDLKKIPLYVSKYSDHLVKDTLRIKGFTDLEIDNFLQEVEQRGIELVFIVDNVEHYNAEACIVTANQRFILLSSNKPGVDFQDRCAYMVPFTGQQIRNYMYNYVRSSKYNRVGWSINRYEYGLDVFNIRDLVEEPLLLRLILSILPSCLKFSKDQDTKQHKIESQVKLQAFTKFDVYEMFINIFIEQKLVTAKYYQKYQNYFTKEQVLEEAKEYAKKLAWRLMIDNSYIITWQATDERSYFEEFFASVSKERRRLLKICHELLPVKIKDIKQENYSCSFLHNSFKDYFIAVNIIEQLRRVVDVNKIEVLNYAIIDNSGLRIFLVDQIIKYALQRKLLEIVYLSKQDPKFAIAAANAITLLNDAKFSFAGLDLSHIKVSGADLRLANFDHTKLSSALLANTKLHGAYLGFAQLDWADLSNVELGELPAILLGVEEPIRDCGLFGGKLYVLSNKRFISYDKQQEGWVQEPIDMTPSSQYEFINGGLLANGVVLTLNKHHIVDFKKPEKFDGVGAINVWHVLVMAIKDNMLAVGLDDGKIIIYDPKASYGKYVYKELVNEEITSLCWGDNYDLFVSGLVKGIFKLARLTSELKGAITNVIELRNVVAVATKGNLLATGLADGQLMLYEQEVRKLELTGHEKRIINIILDEQIIFSNCADGKVCFWEISTGQCLKVLNYINKINKMLLLEGYLGTASEDGSLRFWDLKESKSILLNKGENRTLFCDGAYVAEAKGLTKTQIAVIKQTGGYNKPPHIWRLFRSCKEGNVATVLSLLGEGISVDLNSKWGTPLGVAAKQGHKLLVESLVSRVADVDQPLFYAVSNNKGQVIDNLIAAKANIEAKHNHFGGLATPLYVAVNYGYVGVVKILLEHKANINFVKEEARGDGDSVLGIAARENKVEICKILLTGKADINHQSKLGRTALWNAAYNGHIDIVELLLSYKAIVDLKRVDNGTTALFMAAQGGHMEVVERLIKEGANINEMMVLKEEDKDKMITPLYVAARNDHRAIVGILLEQGADLYEINNGARLMSAGESALSVAKKNDREEIVEMLGKRKGIKISRNSFSFSYVEGSYQSTEEEQQLVEKMLNLQLEAEEEIKTTTPVLFSQKLQTKDTITGLEILLENVVYGKQQEAEAILLQNRQLALLAGNVIDGAGRYFKQITALQYALWALDYHMWTMILKYIPEDEIKRQILSLSSGSWNQEHGKQISWQDLITALQEYISNYAQWDIEKSANYWVQIIGGAQSLLPAHVINEYSRPEQGFASCPDYLQTSSALPIRVGVETWRKNANYCGRVLGENFAWIRGNNTNRLGVSVAIHLEELEMDVQAMSELLKARSTQVGALIASFGVANKNIKLQIS